MLRQVLGITLSLPFLATSALAQCNSNDTTAPCFANVSDILGGRQSLIQDDDLVVAGILIPGTNEDFTGYTTALTANSQVSAANSIVGIAPNNAVGNAVVIRGRTLNLSSDQTLFAQGNSLPAPSQQNASITVEGGLDPLPNLSVLNAPLSLYGAAGPFLGNGYDQFVLAAAQLNSSVHQIALQAIASTSSTNPQFTVGPVTTITNASTIYAVTSGVFFEPSSGQTAPQAQLAVLSGNPYNGNGLTVSLYTVNANLSITPLSSVNLTLGNSANLKVPIFAIAAGRFSGGDHDQIVVAYPAAGTPPQPVKLVTLDFASSPVQKTTFNTAAQYAPAATFLPAIYLQAGRFNWFSSSAQVAVGLDVGHLGVGSSFKQIISFDSSLNATGATPYTAGSSCHFGLAAGRFDRMQPVPGNSSATEADPNLQLADVSSGCTQAGTNAILHIYNVDPSSFAITPQSTANVFDLPLPVATNVASNLVISIAAADTQGRSLALLPPVKATVTGHIQPDTILGLPPMHVDWITPAGQTAPEVLNVSVYPSSFYDQYAFSSSGSETVTRTGTTSYTAASKKTVGAQVSYSSPFGGVSSSTKQSVGQMHQKVVGSKYNTYSGQSSSFATQTVFDDVVAASSSQMNIYSYRVVGQCVPASGAAASEGCPANQGPLYVEYSGPDNVEYIQAAEGRNLEWYQPVQEPGNIFSYPGNQQLMAAELGGGTSFEPLTPTDNYWDSQTNATVATNWTQGSTTGASSGSVAAHSYDSQYSVSAKVSYLGFGAGASASFGYNESSSVSTLNQSSSAVSESSGIILHRGISGSDVGGADYTYEGQSFIYGQTPPTGLIQNDVNLQTTVQATGFVTAAHAVDMVSSGSVTSGNFWPQAYSIPDLALNHPQRWLQKLGHGSISQEVQFICPVGFTSSLTSPSCTPNGQAPNPANVADSSFYLMKGLFVTPGDTTAGPQITNTTLGSKVNLRARIYNYSLQNFPAGTSIHVQFYAQPWGEGEFASQPGNPAEFANAVFIGEGTDAVGDALAPVPAFCGGAANDDPCAQPNAPQNWEFAYATWDTSKNGVSANSVWKFWVVAWAEYNGKLLTELPGHGLKSLPSAPFSSIGAVPVETYSNNLGYYNQVFTVLPASVGTSQQATPLLSLQNIGMRPGATALRDEPVTILATHLSSSQDIHSLLTLYYDGNPDQGGTLFDTQSIDRVPSGSGFVDIARYTPSSCGVHTIYARSIPLDGTVRSTTSEGQIKVTVDPVESVDEMIADLGQLKLSPELHGYLMSFLQRARREFQAGQIDRGLHTLKEFYGAVCDKGIPEPVQADFRQEVEEIEGCLN